MSWHGKSHFSLYWSTQQLSIWDWTESSDPSWGAFKVRPPSFAPSTSSQCQPRVYIWTGVCRGTVTRLASVINKPVQYRLLSPTVGCNVNLPSPDSVWVETWTVTSGQRARSSIPNKLIKMCLAAERWMTHHECGYCTPKTTSQTTLNGLCLNPLFILSMIPSYFTII